MEYGQTGNWIIYQYFEHKTPFLKPTIHKRKLISNAVNSKHPFPNSDNVQLIKSAAEGEIMGILENLYT